MADERTDVGTAHDIAIRPSRGKRRAAILAAIVVGVIGLAVGADVVTSSPALCASCHAMESQVASWERSAHTTVRCVGCHERPRSWYGSPNGLVERARLLSRDLDWQMNGRPKGATDGAQAYSYEVDDENCLQCHDPDREATSGFRILIDHAEHARRNGSCTSCHVSTAHPSGDSTPLSLMVQCYTCHGTKTQPKASATCETCHPPGYELVPATHKEPSWRSEHGGIAQSSPKQCELCHTKASCTSCHGLPMPHPADWARGRTGHAVVAERDRAICQRCHSEKPDLCSMCHHKAYDPSKGDWVRQHFIEVRKKGTDFCFGCHAPVFCVECHAR